MNWYETWSVGAEPGPDRNAVLAMATAFPPDVILRASSGGRSEADVKSAADAYERAFRAHVLSCPPSVSNEECQRGAMAAGTAAADAEIARRGSPPKAEAECPPEVTAKAAELGVMDFIGCNAYRAAVKAGKTKQEATSEAIKVVSTFRAGEGKKGTPAKAPPTAAPSPATYAAPAAAAPAAPAADAPKPAEEPWWSSTAAKATAIGLGAGAITLALLRRK